MKHIPRTKPKQPSDTLRRLQQIAKRDANSKAPASTDELQPRTKEMSARIDDAALRLLNEASAIATEYGFNALDIIAEIHRRTLP